MWEVFDVKMMAMLHTCSKLRIRLQYLLVLFLDRDLSALLFVCLRMTLAKWQLKRFRSDQMVIFFIYKAGKREAKKKNRLVWPRIERKGPNWNPGSWNGHTDTTPRWYSMPWFLHFAVADLMSTLQQQHVYLTLLKVWKVLLKWLNVGAEQLKICESSRACVKSGTMR